MKFHDGVKLTRIQLRHNPVELAAKNRRRIQSCGHLSSSFQGSPDWYLWYVCMASVVIWAIFDASFRGCLLQCFVHDHCFQLLLRNSLIFHDFCPVSPGFSMENGKFPCEFLYDTHELWIFLSTYLFNTIQKWPGMTKSTKIDQQRLNCQNDDQQRQNQQKKNGIDEK